MSVCVRDSISNPICVVRSETIIQQVYQTHKIVDDQMQNHKANVFLACDANRFRLSRLFATSSLKTARTTDVYRDSSYTHCTRICNGHPQRTGLAAGLKRMEKNVCGCASTTICPPSPHTVFVEWKIPPVISKKTICAKILVSDPQSQAFQFM